MDHLKKTCSSVLAVILAVSTTLAGLPATTVLAAPETYAAAQIAVNAERVNESAVKEALEAVKKARETGSREDYIKARNLIALLRPIDRLRLYADLIKDFYRRNYRNSGFRFFNAQKYLAENEDVRLDALRYSPDDIYSYALNHYLEHGITEGRSSGTDFDPMVAILAKPETLFDVIASNDDAVSDTLYESFVHKTGKTTTDSYSVLGDSLTVIEKADTGIAVPVPSVSPSSTSSSGSNSSKEEGSESQKPGEVPGDQKDYREPDFVIKNLSREITPYTLYRNSYDNESFSFVTNNPFEGANNNMAVNVRFLGDNYRRARERAENKKYTLMLYVCGTNLENNKDYRLVSGEIVSMLQADMDNVNVILCVGGTERYGNDYLNDPEYGASGLRAGIYYLDPSALSAEAKNKINDIKIDCGDDVILQLSDNEEDNNGTNLSHGLHFRDIITSDTLIQLVSTSAVDMADPSFLAGFINLSTNLFPADDYGLTLSDHGGGLEGGVIFTDSNSELQADGIAVYKLESALASTDLYKDRDVSPDGKLGVIFYSACTMGSTELAYITKDYYRYMIASEEVTSGYDPYRDIISGLNYDVGTGASDCSIAKGITYKYETCSSTHHGINDYFVGSIATYSSDDMSNMYDKINDLAAEFSEILGTDSDYSPVMKSDVFAAIRKASLSCYPTSAANVSHDFIRHMVTTSYVDIGELLTHVKKNLDSVKNAGYNSYDPSDKDEFDRLLNKLEETLNTGFLVYLSIYNKEMGGITASGMGDEVIPLNYTMNTSGNIWTDIRTSDGQRDYLYGSSIYLPLRAEEAGFNSTDSEYYKYFKDSDLNNYVEFISDYLRYLNNDYANSYGLNDLQMELRNIPLYNLVSQDKNGGTGALTTLSDENGNARNYIRFKIADSYDDIGVSAPEHSLGSPMLDILEASPIITMAAIHKQRFAANKGDEEGYLEVSMVCAEQQIPSFCFALDSNTISFDVTDETRSLIKAITMDGHILGSESEYIDWQFVLRADGEIADDDRAAILRAALGEDYNADVNAITVLGKFRYEVTEGTTINPYDKDGYHVFTVSDDDTSKYIYSSSVFEDTGSEGSSYSKADNVIGVSAYHYVLKEETDDDGKTKYTKVRLEDMELGDNGAKVEAGFFSVERGLSLNTDSLVTQWESVDGQDTFSGKATGYCLDMTGIGVYSEIGYVTSEGKEVFTGSVTTGNGPLETIEISPGYNGGNIEGIGSFVTEDPVDTPTPDKAEDDLPIHTVPDNASVLVEGCAAIETPVENNDPQDTIEPALVEPRREDAEPEESSSGDDADTGDGGDDDDDDDSSSDSSESDSGECEE